MQNYHQYSKEIFDRRLKKYGISHFLMPSSEQERSIIKKLLNGESLESYYRNLVLTC